MAGAGLRAADLWPSESDWNYLHAWNVAVDEYDDRNSRVREVGQELSRDAWWAADPDGGFRSMDEKTMESWRRFYLCSPWRESFSSLHSTWQWSDSLNDWWKSVVVGVGRSFWSS